MWVFVSRHLPVYKINHACLKVFGGFRGKVEASIPSLSKIFGQMSLVFAEFQYFRNCFFLMLFPWKSVRMALIESDLVLNNIYEFSWSKKPAQNFVIGKPNSFRFRRGKYVAKSEKERSASIFVKFNRVT